jgi:hypothetical protein
MSRRASRNAATTAVKAVQQSFSAIDTEGQQQERPRESSPVGCKTWIEEVIGSRPPDALGSPLAFLCL